MNWNEKFYNKNEKPLDNLVGGYSNTSIFRKIAFIGDSLSSGEFETCDKDGNKAYHDLFEYSWGQFIARKNGLTAYNFSRGGMTAKEYIESFAETNDFFNRDKACQCYVIALGANDLNSDIEIGSVNDINKEDYTQNKPTFLGFYGAIISRYKAISPDAKFFLVTFPKDDSRTTNPKFKAFYNELYNLTKLFNNSYVIDLYKYGPVYDADFKKQFFLHGHMNPSGYVLTAELIDSYIDFIIRHNPEDFYNVGFINSGIKYNF